MDGRAHMEFVLLDRLIENLAARESEWARIRMENYITFRTWNQFIDRAKWNM